MLRWRFPGLYRGRRLMFLHPYPAVSGLAPEPGQPIGAEGKEVLETNHCHWRRSVAVLPCFRRGGKNNRSTFWTASRSLYPVSTGKVCPVTGHRSRSKGLSGFLRGCGTRRFRPNGGESRASEASLIHPPGAGAPTRTIGTDHRPSRSSGRTGSSCKRSARRIRPCGSHPNRL